MRTLFVLFFVLICSMSMGQAQDDINIEIPSLGPIIGRRKQTRENQRTYFSFQGVPFAERPKRFTEAVPVKPWNNIYDARNERPSCVNSNVFLKFPQSENCLHLNIYTPEIPSNGKESLRPVLFWIHGGAFMIGNINFNSTGPDNFLEEDLVVVQVNYRLNLFGFMSTNSEVFAKNLGFKDVIMSLRWIQENIKYFGGDSKNVAIFGQSAGAAIIGYLLQSPLTQNKGYYKRAILDSGSDLHGWALQRHPEKVFGSVTEGTICPLTNILGGEKIQKRCLSKMSTKKLQNLAAIVGTFRSVNQLEILNGLPFAPIIESSEDINAAITQNAWSSLQKNKNRPGVEILTGINSEESLYFAPIIQDIKVLLGQIDLNPDILVPDDMYLSGTNKTIVAEKLREYYFRDQSVVFSATANFLRYVSDRAFNIPLREFLTLISKRAPTYCYLFSYSPNGPDQSNVTGLGNVGHSGELPYLWDMNGAENSQSKLVRKRMVRMWSNFVKYGKPTPKEDELLENVIWPESQSKRTISETNVNCILINENLGIIENPKNKQYLMWRNLYNEYANPKDTF